MRCGSTAVSNFIATVANVTCLQSPLTNKPTNQPSQTHAYRAAYFSVITTMLACSMVVPYLPNTNPLKNIAVSAGMKMIPPVAAEVVAVVTVAVVLVAVVVVVVVDLKWMGG